MSHFPVAVIHEEPEQLHDLLLPYMENCCDTPPREYMEFYEDEDCDVDPDTGKRGYWQNPNAKWDWWMLGGRWRGMLRATDGEYAPVPHFDGDETRWSEPEPYPAGRYDVAKLGDLKWEQMESAPFAVVTPDGKWHEVGTMCWWGMSSDTPDERREWDSGFEERFVKPYPSHFWMAIVDCHI